MRKVLAISLLALTGLAADWPQYFGPGRDGVVDGKGLQKKWPAKGPALVWTCDAAGLGYSGLAVIGDTVYTMGARGDTEYLLAFDGKGKELWAAPVGPVFDFDGNAWSRGPNATPTIDGDRVYGLSSAGVVACVDRSQKGKEIWKKDLAKDLKAEVNPIAGGKGGWGFSWSPLVDGEQLICAPGGPGGLLASLDKMTGAVNWQSKDVPELCTYSSPIAAEIGGTRQYIATTQDGAVGVEARTGALLWRYKRDFPNSDVVCPAPLCAGNKVYLSSWKGGGTLLDIKGAGGKFAATVVYETREIANTHGGVVKVGEHVYGYHQDRGGWMCQDFATGRVVWNTRRVRGALPMGAVVAAGDRLITVCEAGARNEPGVVGLLELTPTKYSEISRFILPKASTKRKARGNVWTHPSVANGHLYVRDQELLFCYKID